MSVSTTPTPDQLWSLANTITAFSIAQSLAFLYALGKDLRDLQQLNFKKQVIITLALITCPLCYIYAIVTINHLAIHLCKNSMVVINVFVWNTVTNGRIAAIFIFMLLSIFGLFIDRIMMSANVKDNNSENIKETSSNL